MKVFLLSLLVAPLNLAQQPTNAPVSPDSTARLGVENEERATRNLKLITQSIRQNCGKEAVRWFDKNQSGVLERAELVEFDHAHKNYSRIRWRKILEHFDRDHDGELDQKEQNEFAKHSSDPEFGPGEFIVYLKDPQHYPHASFKVRPRRNFQESWRQMIKSGRGDPYLFQAITDNDANWLIPLYHRTAETNRFPVVLGLATAGGEKAVHALIADFERLNRKSVSTAAEWNAAGRDILGLGLLADRSTSAFSFLTNQAASSVAKLTARWWESFLWRIDPAATAISSLGLSGRPEAKDFLQRLSRLPNFPSGIRGHVVSAQFYWTIRTEDGFAAARDQFAFPDDTDSDFQWWKNTPEGKKWLGWDAAMREANGH